MNETAMSAAELDDHMQTATWAASIGPWSRSDELSMPLGTACVLAGSLGGSPVVVKQHVRRKNYVRERDALINWAPRLQEGGTPTLLTYDDSLSLLVMSRLDGSECDGTDAQDHFRAARLLSQLHSIELAHSEEQKSGIDEARARFENTVSAASTCVEPRILDFAERSFFEAIPLIASLPQGVIHNDFQPRNWLSLRTFPFTALIDFGKSRRGLLVTDFERLYFQDWARKPDGSDLRAAFEAGYGRKVTDLEMEVVRLLGPMQAIGTIAYARASGSTDFETHGMSILEASR